MLHGKNFLFTVFTLGSVSAVNAVNTHLRIKRAVELPLTLFLNGLYSKGC